MKTICSPNWQPVGETEKTRFKELRQNNLLHELATKLCGSGADGMLGWSLLWPSSNLNKIYERRNETREGGGSLTPFSVGFEPGVRHSQWSCRASPLLLQQLCVQRQGTQARSTELSKDGSASQKEWQRRQGKTENRPGGVREFLLNMMEENLFPERTTLS